VARETILDWVRKMLPNICAVPYNVSEDKAETNMSLFWYQRQPMEYINTREFTYNDAASPQTF
jgi:hypothetical protein